MVYHHPEKRGALSDVNGAVKGFPTGKFHFYPVKMPKLYRREKTWTFFKDKSNKNIFS